jgi:hypothetical protein
MKMLHGKKLIMYFKNFQNENQCLLGTRYNCEGFGIYFIAILLIGIKRCKKKEKNYKKVGYPCAQSKLQHCCLLCIWQVHAKQQIGTQLLSTYCYMFP